MIHSLYLAWHYLRFHQGKTLLLVAAISLIMTLPLTVQRLVRASETHLMARAQATPLVIGQKGSALDLVLHALYFTTAPPATTSMAEVRHVQDLGVATAIPMYTRFTARSYPIVGTTLDYFAFRHLFIQSGRSLALLGECVLGATVAEALRLRPGDVLLSSPENLFDLAGSYPLKMSVVGVLHATHTPDDLAVFVDLKTAWIIHGLGHGHQDVATTADPQMILQQQQANLVASAKLLPYTEITPETLDALHFHGDPSTFPLTAIVALPHDDKSAVLLMGHYLSETNPLQIVKPPQVIAVVLRHIFTIKRLFDAIFGVVSVAMALAIVLILTLSFRLRQAEIDTIFKLGCSRRKVVELMAAELCLIVLMSLAVTIGFTLATAPWHTGLMQWLLHTSTVQLGV